MDGYTEPHIQPIKSSSRQNIPRCRNSITSTNEEHPHIGNYRLLKTIGKGNFAKVKLARHVLTGREVSLEKKKRLIVWFVFFGYLYNKYFFIEAVSGYRSYLTCLSFHLTTHLAPFLKYSFLVKGSKCLLCIKWYFRAGKVSVHPQAFLKLKRNVLIGGLHWYW